MGTVPQEFVQGWSKTPRYRAATITKAEGDDAKARRVKFIASDESVDRYGDIIRVAGWDLANFRNNPVLLFGHDSRSIIGRVPEIGIEGRQLIATCEFRPEGDSELADDIWRGVQGDFIRATSVGFLPTVEPKPIRAEPDEDGYAQITGFEFIGQELLELSVVSVPANPQALALARELRISEASQRRLFASDERAVARIAAERRRQTITLARLRPGPFGGTSP